MTNDPHIPMMQSQNNSKPLSGEEADLARLESMGLGDGPYAQGLRNALEEGKQTGRPGRGIVMSTMVQTGPPEV
jgi:hypothetical protein